jgi:proliferating cell nuclear antigen
MFVSKQSKEATNMEVQMKEKVSMIFGMSYMFSICKLSTLSDHLSDQVTIKLSPELPAVFEYNIKEMGYIRYYVVPAELEITPRRIAEEDKMQN